MNNLQKVELDLLKCFIEICEKLDLKYYLVCGSALGAVKYNGFIPWDDDIDVAMFREDYEKFLQKAPELLPKEFFLSNMHTEKAFPLLMTKLRNSNTTLIETAFSHLPINHGICIDIFPLDGYPSRKIESKIFELKKWIFNKARCFAYLYGHKAFKLNFILLCYERLLKKYPCDKSKVICNHANWQRKLEYASKEQYGDGIKGCFEGLEVIVPLRTDEYLTQKYGNWRGDPPKKESHHCFTICDTTRPYNYYIKI